jgi:hypothetical protein
MNNNNKKGIYIGLFVLLGILLAFIVHGLLEIWYTNKLVADFARYSMGYSWADWLRINNYVYTVLFVAGLLAGNFQGKYWWRVVYEEKRLDPFFRKLRKFLHIRN